MKLKDLMTTELATLTPDCTVLDAAKTMQAHNIGIIPICEDGDKLKGIVTDRDIVVRNIAHDGDPGSTKLKDLMSYELVTATPTMSAKEAAKLMAQHKIRRLPVVEGDKIVGMISIGDLATHKKLSSEAGSALEEISEPSKPFNMS